MPTFPLPLTLRVGSRKKLPYVWAVQRSFIVSCLLLASFAYGGPQPLHPDNPPVPSTVTNAAVKRIAEGIFELGKVRINKNQSQVSFPATVNMQQGMVEYLLVHGTGKVHESVLRTEAEPFHIHTAMLLLGAKGGAVKTKTPEKKTSDVAGDAVVVSIIIKTNGAEKTFRGEDWVLDAQTKTNMNRGTWVYNGSRLIEGSFLAQRDGSVISTIADPDALVNNPRPGRDNDEVWLVNTNLVPVVNTPVEVTIRLDKK